jgi:glycosyltransferase involved in cell wall biosynthesis
LPLAREAGIPVVMHLHDYKLISADYLMFHGGKACTKCAKGKFWHCVNNRCYGSFAKSFLAALETWINRDLLDIYQKNINRYISPSHFLKNMFVSAGYDGQNISVIPNFITNACYVPLEDEKEYLLYAGRLSPEKGIDSLIRGLAGSRYQLRIAGNGPEENNLKQLTEELGISGQIVFLGFLDKDRLNQEMAGSRAAIFPSICFENSPLSLLEALGRGKVCLAANIGGIPEIIKHGDNGLLFRAGDPISIREAINALESINREWMKRAAYDSAQKYLLKDHLPKITAMYQELTKKQA